MRRRHGRINRLGLQRPCVVVLYRQLSRQKDALLKNLEPNRAGRLSWRLHLKNRQRNVQRQSFLARPALEER